MQPEIKGEGQKLTHRYTDAYRVAKLVVAFGTILKWIGWVGAGLVWVLALASKFDIIYVVRIGDSPFALSMIGGAVWWELYFVPGMLASGLGQVLKATVDMSVNTSPFLDSSQRAQIMSLL